MDTVTHATLLTAINTVGDRVNDLCPRVAVLESTQKDHERQLQSLAAISERLEQAAAPLPAIASSTERRVGKLENGMKDLPVMAYEQRRQGMNWDRVILMAMAVMQALMIVLATQVIPKLLAAAK
jgi:hypothetical protein